MSRRRANRVIEVDRTLIALLIVADAALLVLWVILALIVLKDPFSYTSKWIMFAFLLVLAVLVKIASMN